MSERHVMLSGGPRSSDPKLSDLWTSTRRHVRSLEAGP